MKYTHDRLPNSRVFIHDLMPEDIRLILFFIQSINIYSKRRNEKEKEPKYYR